MFSAHAEKVELCLFDPAGRHELQRVELLERTDDIWHGYLPEARPGIPAWLPRVWPLQARRRPSLQPAQAAARPYAKHVVGAIKWSDARFGYRVGIRARTSPSIDATRAAGMPKCRVLDPAFTWGNDRAPRVPWHDTVIYELHVRGFTMRHPGCAARAARHLCRVWPADR